MKSGPDRKFKEVSEKTANAETLVFPVHLTVADRTASGSLSRLNAVFTRLRTATEKLSHHGCEFKITPLDLPTKKPRFFEIHDEQVIKKKTRCSLDVSISVTFNTSIGFWEKSGAIVALVDLIAQFDDKHDKDKDVFIHLSRAWIDTDDPPEDKGENPESPSSEE